MEIETIPHHLSIDLNKFGFVEREKDKNGNTIKNRCGRDFLYYVLNYFDSTNFSPTTLCPSEIENKRIFGIPMPALLVWTNLSFMKVPKLFKRMNLTLSINSIQINSFIDFIRAMIFSKHLEFKETLELIKAEIEKQNVVGIDIAISLNGLVDHVMFVYGYDDVNLYAFDTRKVFGIDYEKLTPEGDKRFIMKLPFTEIEPRWKTRWNRVWVVMKT